MSEFTGPGPSAWKELNPDAHEFFYGDWWGDD